MGTSQEPFSGANERDVLDVRERLDLQCTSVSNLVLYARGEWTQGDGNLAESGGLSQVNGVGPAPIQRETEDSRFFQKYSAGVRWYALRRTTLDVGGYYKDNDYEYDCGLHIHWAEFFTDAEIVAAESVPHCRPEDIVLSNIVHINGYVKHGVERNHVRAYKTEGVSVMIRSDPGHVLE